MMLPQLETDRLLLRPLALTDAETIRTLASDYEIASTTLNIPHPYPEGTAERFITRTLESAEKGSFNTFGIVRKADGLLIGCMGIAGLHQTHRTAELAYWIGRPYWSNGYATEAGKRVLAYAFEELKANRVWAQFFTRNPASGRVMQKLGMTFEGTLRQHVNKWGQFEDLGTYGILRAEFQSIAREG